MTEACAGNAYSVLIADDHVGLRSVIRPLLERNGFYVCGEVGDASAAIDSAIQNEPDLCLIDIKMPGNGIAATAAITASVPATRVVILTVSRTDADLFRAIQAGAVGYVLKDDSLRDLTPALRRVMKGEALISGELMTRILGEFRLRGKRYPGSRRRDKQLTPREWEVLEHLSMGLTTSEIALRIGVQDVTVRTHISTMLKKYHVSSRQAALRLYREHNGE
jgi:DNA-binding NarL/FixJ family response regulator